MRPAFQLSEAISGVPPERVYEQLCDPQALLGLQPLLVAVERVQRRQQGSAAGDPAATQPASGQQDAGELAAGGTGGQGPEEVGFAAVEAVPLLWGALRWRNRIAVRQLLLGAGGDAPTPAAPAAAAAAGGADGGAATQPLRMRYSVVSPPAGLVRLEVAWTFCPLPEPAAQPGGSGGQYDDAPAAPATGGGGSSSGGGTRVQLDVSIRAPWLLRDFVESQARRAQAALLANLRRRLERPGAEV